MTEAFWERFQMKRLKGARRVRGSRRNEAIPCSGCLHLSADPCENDRILMGVLEGRRTALVSTMEQLHRQGREIMGGSRYYILLDSADEPRAVVQCTGAHTVEYRRMPTDWALQEGEENSLQAWQARWRTVFLQEAREKGVPLSLENKLLLTELFTLAYSEE